MARVMKSGKKVSKYQLAAIMISGSKYRIYYTKYSIIVRNFKRAKHCRVIFAPRGVTAFYLWLA